MANDLTGDFDFVGEFAVTAVNRLLAAMHAGERFPHSLSARIDDDAPPGSGPVRPPLVGSVNAFGEAVVSHLDIGKPVPLAGSAFTANPVSIVIDPVVNATSGGFVDPPPVPSHLTGVTQLQFSAPWIEIADQSGTGVAVRMEIRSRYLPDLQTPPVAEFIRGELTLSAALNQVASQAANVIEVDIKADSVGVSFTPENVTLSANDLAAIIQLIRNTLKASFLPSNAPLPASIRFLQFKALAQSPGAIAALLNTTGNRGDPSTVSNVFLGGGDDFALGVGRDFIVAAFQPVVSSILSQPIPDFTISISLLFGSVDITYSMTLSSVTLDLAAGKLVLTIKGHGHTSSSIAPDFDFTVTQNFGLAADGATANLVVEDISVDTSSWLVDLFKSGALPSLEQARDQALRDSNVQATVRQLLSVDATLGGFLRSLLNASGQGNTPPPISMQLAYTSIDIQPSGIALHGSLAVSWPSPHFEFQKIPSTPRGRLGIVPLAPEYSALNAWIPGGKIDQFEWNSQGESQPFLIDPDKFVLLPGPPANSTGAVTVSGYVPLCLTVRGTRPPASGAGPAEPVSGNVCGYTVHPIVSGGIVSTTGSAPAVAMVQKGPSGLVEVTGHTLAQTDQTGHGTPNLIVHFADAKSAAELEVLTAALQSCGRNDSAASILAVLNASELPKSPYRSGIIYSEEQGSTWEQIFGVRSAQRPLTILVNPQGKVVWSHAGSIDSKTLSDALAKFLVSGRPPGSAVLRADLRLGRLSPDFLFPYADGKQLTLRKLAGRAATLVFWKCSVRASIDAVRDVESAGASASGAAPLVLAINDGEPAGTAQKAAASNKLAAIVVADPERDISAAYGVTLWPTIVSLDAKGLIQEVRYGRS
jgi:hypothetical protein